MFSVENLAAQIKDGQQILHDVSFKLGSGEIHLLMGPNGAGKSTLLQVLMGSKSYQETAGKVVLEGEDITALDAPSRAKKGLFLAYQYPVAIPGLRISEYLRNLYALRHNTQVNVSEFRKLLKDKLQLLQLSPSSLQRYLNEGFSGGEMKRFEMLQMLLLEPKVALLDEIDSGVDVDAQRLVASAINYAKEHFGTTFLIVTHYKRLLSFLEPTALHVLLEGKIARSGGVHLVDELERQGYELFRQPKGDTA